MLLGFRVIQNPCNSKSVITIANITTFNNAMTASCSSIGATFISLTSIESNDYYFQSDYIFLNGNGRDYVASLIHTKIGTE